jgi:hypothetical protein
MQAAFRQDFKLNETIFICKNQTTKLIWRLMTARRVAMRKPLWIGMRRSRVEG